MKLFRSSLGRLVTGVVGLLIAPFAVHAAQTITATSGQVGVVYSYQVTSNATPPLQYGASGLPAGLAINASSGVISGTPTTPGTVVGDVSVTSNGQTNHANISITIAAAANTPVINSALTASGTVGAAFTYNTTATNTPTSFNITGLPAGLSADVTTGVISGTPLAAGASSVSLSANNSGGTGVTATLALTIAAPAAAPVVTSASSASVAVGAGFSYTITATNTPTSFAATGLPLGLSVDVATGAITGTPTVAGVYSVGLSATNGSGTSAVVNLSLTVGDLSAITSANTATATVGTAFSYTVTASPAATSFNVTGLPAGLTADTSTGVISGTPTVAGVSSINLSANNATGSGPVTVLTLTAGNRPAITSATSATGLPGVAFTYTITASNSPTSFNATGLPSGLSVNTTTGVISGSPTASGSFSVSLTATNSFGTSNAVSLNLVIGNPAPTVIAPVFASNPQGGNVSVNGTIVLSASATGTPTPTYQWRRNGVDVVGGTSSTLTLGNIHMSDAGIYTLVASNAGGAVTSQAAVVGVTTVNKYSGEASVVATNIIHPNGNIYDQVVLIGPSAGVVADPGKITRVSFIDLSDDIVQVEFSGAGTLSLSLDNASGPAAPVKYNQPGVTYMKGHASIVIAGADATTNVSVFSVGKITAVNHALFPVGQTYDGMADIGVLAITSTDGKVAAIRTANASYLATSGLTGVYAPGVTVTGPSYVGNITAASTATPSLQFAGTSDLRVTGGDLLQLNNRSVQASGFTTIRFTAGTHSDGQVIPAQTNKARFERNGVDVTPTISVTN